MDVSPPQTTAELRQVLGATPWLFVVGADDNPTPDVDHCGDGTTVIWSAVVKPGYPPRWFVAFSERGRVSEEDPEASFLREADACWFAWIRCHRPFGPKATRADK